MKKIFSFAAIAAVALSFSLSSCAKSAEDYVKEMAKLENEYNEAVESNDDAKAAEIKEKQEALDKEVKEKCQKDPEFQKELKAAAAQAAAEEMQNKN